MINKNSPSHHDKVVELGFLNPHKSLTICYFIYIRILIIINNRYRNYTHITLLHEGLTSLFHLH